MLACFREAYAEAQHQSNSEADRQKRNYDSATSTVQLMPGDIVLKKADMSQGKRKVKDQWSESGIQGCTPSRKWCALIRDKRLKR